MDKSVLLSELLSGIADRVGEMKTEAEHDSFRADGASRALLQAASGVLALAKLVDDDLEKGRYDLEVAKVVKQYIGRAGQTLMDLGKHQQNLRLIAQGRAQGVQDVATFAAKRQAEEDRKTELQAAEARLAVAASSQVVIGEDGPWSSERSGHPGPSLKARRLAEEALSEASEKAGKVLERGVAALAQVFDQVSVSTATETAQHLDGVAKLETMSDSQPPFLPSVETVTSDRTAIDDPQKRATWAPPAGKPKRRR